MRLPNDFGGGLGAHKRLTSIPVVADPSWNAAKSTRWAQRKTLARMGVESSHAKPTIATATIAVAIVSWNGMSDVNDRKVPVVKVPPAAMAKWLSLPVVKTGPALDRKMDRIARFSPILRQTCL